MGISGDPQAQEVIDYLQSLASDHRLGVREAITQMLAGFRKGFDANTAAYGEEQVLGLTYPTPSVAEIMYELSSQAQTLGTGMTWEEAERIIKRYLPTPAKTGAETVPEDAGQGDLQAVEDYRTVAHAVAAEIFGHPNHRLSESLVTLGQPFDIHDTVHINNVANEVIDGIEPISILKDLVDKLQLQLARLDDNVSPLDSGKSTAGEDKALQYVPLTGNAIYRAEDLIGDIQRHITKLKGRPGSQSIVPHRKGEQIHEVFDPIWAGRVFREVLEGKRDIQDLQDMYDILSAQSTKVGSTPEDIVGKAAGQMFEDALPSTAADTSFLGNGTTNELVGSTAADIVGGAAEGMLAEAELTVDPNITNETDLAQRLEVLKGNRVTEGRTRRPGTKKEMTKEKRLMNIGTMARLAMETDDKNLLFTAKSMHRILKNDYPDLIEWDIFLDKMTSPAMAAILEGKTDQPQYNVRT
jgi:hypothetical protein